MRSVLTWTAEIRNPVSLARILLDHTSQTLTLRRVPPNLLVGQGATDFASEHCMPVLPFECMVSPNARERWRRWREDLNRAERNRQMEEGRRYGLSPEPSPSATPDPHGRNAEQIAARKAHTARLMLQNEGQPISPPPSDDLDFLPASPSSRTASSMGLLPDYDADDTASNTTVEYMDPEGPPGILTSISRNPFANSTQKIPSLASMAYPGSHTSSDGGLMGSRWAEPSDTTLHSESDTFSSPSMHERHGSSDSGESGRTAIGLTMPPHWQPRADRLDDEKALEEASSSPLPETPLEGKQESPTPNASTPLMHVKNAPPLPPDVELTNEGCKGDDVITDTVGAIAIDVHGNIAAAASSGGIGMKHRGRIGPAALVGVGATVIPADQDDLEQTTVATVTSGTGEHMGTTMAASVCSDRIYNGLRRVPGGTYEQCTDDEAVQSFIKKDFMGHPSVTTSNSSGAIGILSVKKTKDGVWLYFAHNTDSFALASYHSDEAKPVCTMSRNKGNGSIAQGGRGIRFGPRRRKV